MTKSLSAALATHLEGEYLTTATCWKLKRVDGPLLGFTDHDEDLTIDVGDGDGAITYKAATGYTRTAIANSAEMNVDDVDVDIVLDDLAINADDIRAGRYDSAEIKVFLVNYKDLSQGVLKLRRGKIGEIRLFDDDRATAELRGMAQQLSQKIIELYTPDCRADLGDVRCKVRLDPPAWTATTAFTVRPSFDADLGSVVKPTIENDRYFKCTTAGTSDATEPAWNLTLGGTTADGTVVWTTIQGLTVTAKVTAIFGSDQQFDIDYAGDAPDALLTGGVATFDDGLNVGIKREVKSWTLSTTKVHLFLRTPFRILIGDSLTISAGCDKIDSTCRDTFDNIHNLRGEPLVPGQNIALNFPDAPTG